MSKVIDWIFEHQWAITEDALRTIVCIADRERGDIDLILKGEKDIDTHALSARLGQPMEGSVRTVIRDDVAVIPVTGPIFPRANLFTMISGATSLDILARDFTLALENPAVKSIVLNMDSPGGEVTGVSEMSKMIFSARGKKPIIAYVFGRAASAAYWLASAADTIVASPTSQLGSVGVIAVLQDTRARDEKSGVKTVEFVSSVSPHKNLDIDSDAGRARIQAVVDSLAEVMVSDIARNRGVDNKKVLSDFGQGGIFIGALAVGQGLADELGSLEQVIAAHNSTNIQMKGGSMDLMELQTKHPELYQQAIALGKEEAAKANTEAVSQAREEGAETENARIKSIEAVKAPGFEELVAGNKFDRKQTVETISALIVKEQAAKVEKDAAALAAQTRELGSGASDFASNDPEAKLLIDAMVAGGNSRRR